MNVARRLLFLLAAVAVFVSTGLAAAPGTESNPGTSCHSIYVNGGSNGDGTYWINPDGSGGVSKFQVYCVMGKNGAGWIKMNVGSNYRVITHGNANKYTGEDAWSYLTDTELGNSIESTSDGTYTYDVTYNNPATDSAFTSGQVSAIRSVIEKLSDDTRMQIEDDDSDLDEGCDGGNACGTQYYHSVDLVAEDGSQIAAQARVTCYSGGGSSNPSYTVTRWTDDSRSSYGNHGTACFSPPSNSLPTEYLIPDKIVHYDGSGGGAAWGYEKPYFLVRSTDSTVGGGWQDTSYRYRRAVTVSETSGSSQSNYQTKVTIDTASLISNGKMQSDCDDMRWYSGSTQLDYWIEGSSCNTASTEVWVEIPSLSANSDKTIYMYYGNSGALSGESRLGTQTMPGFSCRQIYQEGDSTGNGYYYIDPNGQSTNDAFQVFCSMSTGSGGWMKLSFANAGSDDILVGQNSDGNGIQYCGGNGYYFHTSVDASNADYTGGSHLFDIDWQSGSNVFSESQENTIRSNIPFDTLYSGTQFVGRSCDDDGSYGSDHDMQLRATDGGSEWILHDGYADGSNNYGWWVISGQDSSNNYYNFESGSTSVNTGRTVPDKYLFPAEAYYTRGSGGGAAFGFENSRYVLLKDSSGLFGNPDTSTSVGSEVAFPADPQNPSPSNGATGISTSPSLGAKYVSPDGSSGTLYFYNATDDTVINSCSVSSGSRCSIDVSGLADGTTYSWYVRADNGFTNRGPIWSFTTNHYPAIEQDAAFTDSSTDHVFDIGAAVSDGDGDGDISSCTVFYTDPDGNSGTVAGSVGTGFGTSTEASCNASISRSTSNVQVGEQLDIIVQFTDGNGRKANTTTAQHAVPNHAPTVVQGNAFDNASAEHMFNVTAVGKDTDAGSGELSSCTVTHSDGESTYATAGNLDTSYGTTDEASCELRIAAEVEGGFSGYLPGERISVDVRFTDVHGATVTTSQTSNPVPNRKPEIHPPILTFPSAPDVLDNVTTRVNTSDVGDPVRYANFTVWEYNQDTENRLFVNENGTMWRNGSFQLWNATEFQADLENATYNFSLTVSDGYAEVRRSGKLFTLEAVKPDVSELSFYRPDPWGVAETWFRPGQGLGAYVTVTDANGRGDIVSYGGQAIDPNGQTFTVSSFDVENQVLNGYNLSIFYSVPDDAVSGDWDMRITATDDDALQESNRSTFHVTSYTSVTASLEQSLQNDTVYVDGEEASDGVYTDSEVSFPYAVRVWRRLLTGVINYGRFTQLTVAGDVLSMQQEFADNQFLLPVTEASVFDLEQLEDEFTGSLLSDRSFLEHAVASIGYGTTDEKTVRVAARFEENERIQIRGFEGSLSSGFHELLLQKQGVENGSTVVSVELVR